MKTSSAKAKGRRLQQSICKMLLAIGADFGLEPDDIQSRGMGQNGVDVMLSPAARKLFNLAIEAKNVEKLNVSTTFLEHYKKYEKDDTLKLLIHSKNHSHELVTMLWGDFCLILSELVKYENTRKIGFSSRSKK